MSYEEIPFPTGSTPQQLYSHQISLTASLRRVLRGISDTDAESGLDLGAVTDQVAALNSALDLIAGRVDDLEATGGSLTPQQAFELSLITEVDTVFGSLASVRQRQLTAAERDAESTIAAAINAHQATTGVRTEVRVRSEADLALAQQIDTVTATLGLTNASVVALTSAVADGDTALATQITNVESQVAGNTASVAILTASVNGIATKFAVELNNNGEVVGFFRLDGGQSGSAFTVAASNFFVSSVGTTGGAAVPVFAISTVNGASKMVLRGDMIADGTISARNIIAGQILAYHIAAGQVTADKIAVASLSAITGNVGDLTAGIIRSPDNQVIFDLANMRIYRPDGKLDFNMKTLRLRMSS